MAAFQVITEGGCECSVRSVPPEVGVVLIRTLNRLDNVAGFPNALLGAGDGTDRSTGNLEFGLLALIGRLSKHCRGIDCSEENVDLICVAESGAASEYASDEGR